MVGSMHKRVGILLVAGMAASAVFRPDSAMAASSSVADDAKAANIIVSTTTSVQTASQTGNIIASAVGGAITPGAPTAVLGVPGGFASQGIDDRLSMADGYLVGSFFSTRAIAAGKSAAANQPRVGAWVQGAYTFVDNNETGGKFDGGIANIVAGIDFKPGMLNDKGVVGLAVGYEDVDVDTSFNNGTFDGDGFTIAPYFGYSFTPNWTGDIAIGYSNLDYNFTRTNGAVSGNFDADRLFGAANVTGTFFRKNLRIAPKVGFLVLYEDQEAFTDSAGTPVGSTTIHLGRANLGAELGYTYKAKGTSIEPFVSVKGSWDFNRNSPVTLTTGSIASDDELSGTFGLGVNFRGKGNLSGQIKGETNQFKNDISTYTISGRVRVNF